MGAFGAHQTFSWHLRTMMEAMNLKRRSSETQKVKRYEAVKKIEQFDDDLKMTGLKPVV